MERIPDFDEAWLQPVQQTGPAAGIERKAVVERAGPVIAGYRRDSARLQLLVLTRNEKGVAPPRVCAQPALLRREISLHSAARRRIEQSRIDEMHEFHGA